MYKMTVKENMMDSSKFEVWEPVFLQIIDALQSLEVNEPVVFNGTDAPFFTSAENFLEFQLAGKYILAHVEEV